MGLSGAVYLFCLLFQVDGFWLSRQIKIATICLLKLAQIGRHTVFKSHRKIAKLGQNTRFYEPLQQVST